MLIQEYANYLIREGLSERSARIYTRKIQDLLSQGYNEETICNAIEEFIYMYSRGGKCYDPKDHGNTLSALKRLRNMLLEPYADNFFISYRYITFWIEVNYSITHNFSFKFTNYNY